MRRAAASFAVLLLLSACGGSTLSSSSVKACHTNADCSTGESCQFSVYESCGNAGACVATPDGAACINQVACGCNGGTETICLVNGNAPSPVESLGSCDGATQQQGFDATSGSVDATIAPVPDAGDSGGQGTPQEDSGSVEEEDSSPQLDAADAASSTLLGTPCTSDTQCAADPVYQECRTVNGSKICTATCFTDGNCQPPANGTCNEGEGYCELE